MFNIKIASGSESSILITKSLDSSALRWNRKALVSIIRKKYMTSPQENITQIAMIRAETKES